METTDDQQQDRGQAAGFRRAVWLQVYLPLMIGASLVVGGVAYGLVIGGPGGPTTSGMADVALVALLLPAMLLGVFGLAVVVLLTVGVARLIGWIPARSSRVRRIAAQASWQTDQIAGRVVQVIVAPKSAWGALRAFWARLSGRE